MSKLGLQPWRSIEGQLRFIVQSSRWYATLQ